jgi:hypothetical protein
MRHLFTLAIMATALQAVGCGTELTASTGADQAAPAGVSTTPIAAPDAPADPAVDDGAPAAPAADDAPAADPPADAPAADAPAADTPAAGAPGSVPPPAEQSQTCQAWQDCGPHFGDLNSGFDCDGGQCACNVAGTYDDDCAAIGGLWSEEECFCFVTQSRPPEPANDAGNNDDAPWCWWRWHEECEPDEWVDTSYYRRECDSSGCYNRYISRGHWVDGYCNDVWTKTCDDGSRQVYR